MGIILDYILESIDYQKSTPINEADNDNANSNTTDDDFSIDTNLDDIDDSDDNSGNSDNTANDDTADDTLDLGTSSDDSSSDNSSVDSKEDDTSDEAMEANTDIFDSLTAEEQKIKIVELKKLFNELYVSLDDIADRVNNIRVEEYNKHDLVKLQYILYDFKKFLSDYILTNFSQKSYFENDVAYNRFLDIINSILEILEKLASDKEKYMEQEKI